MIHDTHFSIQIIYFFYNLHETHNKNKRVKTYTCIGITFFYLIELLKTIHDFYTKLKLFEYSACNILFSEENECFTFFQNLVFLHCSIISFNHAFCKALTRRRDFKNLLLFKTEIRVKIINSKEILKFNYSTNSILVYLNWLMCIAMSLWTRTYLSKVGPIVLNFVHKIFNTKGFLYKTLKIISQSKQIVN